MPQLIDFLVQERVLSEEAVKRLKAAWVTNIDELYSRIRACDFSGKPEMTRAMEQELGLGEGKLEGFKKYITPYVSPDVVNAEKPREHPLGLRTK